MVVVGCRQQCARIRMLCAILYGLITHISLDEVIDPVESG